MKTKTVSVLTCALLIHVAKAWAGEGGHVGGGDPSELEFASMANMGIQQLVTRAEELRFDPKWSCPGLVDT